MERIGGMLDPNFTRAELLSTIDESSHNANTDTVCFTSQQKFV